MNTFDWGTPKENWCKMPHALIDALSIMETEAEMKVVLYVLRHTWGFGEYAEAKKITTDEFVNGRKDKTGKRLDKGTGLSEPSIRNGVRRAIEHGLLVVQEDNRDMARQKRFYMLAGNEENTIESGGKTFTPEGKSLTPGGKNIYPRSEKDTIRKKQKKEDRPTPPDKLRGTVDEPFFSPQKATAVTGAVVQLDKPTAHLPENKEVVIPAPPAPPIGDGSGLAKLGELSLGLSEERKRNNGQRYAGWHGELNKIVEPGLRAQLAKELAETCGLTLAMASSDATLREVHEKAVEFYTAGLRTVEGIKQLKEKYLAVPWNKANHPKPSLASLFKFYSKNADTLAVVVTPVTPVTGQVSIGFSNM